jgi:hypothetical protein
MAINRPRIYISPLRHTTVQHQPRARRALSPAAVAAPKNGKKTVTHGCGGLAASPSASSFRWRLSSRTNRTMIKKCAVPSRCLRGRLFDGWARTAAKLDEKLYLIQISSRMASTASADGKASVATTLTTFNHALQMK